MFGAFFKQINALHGKENTTQLQAQYGTQNFVHQALKKILLLGVTGVAYDYHFDITGCNSIESLSL